MSEVLRATQAALGGDIGDPAYTDRMREDFDRLAVLSAGSGWDHNSHYHPFLLRQLPERLGEALDVGCGTGAFARSLARRCERVLAVDLSPRMVEVAKSRSRGHPNVEYVFADVNSWNFPKQRFDCVASITTLHHLPLAPTLARMGGALRSGGTLLVLDLFRARGLADTLVGAAGFAVGKAIRLAKTGERHAHQSTELRRAWEEHGSTDRYPTLAEVRQACAEAGLTGRG